MKYFSKYPSICLFATLAMSCGTGELTENPSGDDFADCDSTAHGASETRTRYASESVASDASCDSEEQTRTCDDGTWGEWSGTYTFGSCDVQGFASCDGTPHGGEQTRTRFETDTVDSDGTCVSEQQSRTCDDGTWGDWSGSYGFESCIVEGGPQSCGDTAHGESESRIR